MSTRRLLGTLVGMAGLAVGLAALTPGQAELAATLADPQRTADTVGPDALVLALAGLLAWLVWAWGAVGLLLTAASALPGLVGAVARGVLTVLVPAGARRSAAVLLGLGVGVAAPLLPALPAYGPAIASAAAPVAAPVPDWATGAPVADWPTAQPTADPVADWPAAEPAPDWPGPVDDRAHVVVRGDCLWRVAGGWLQARLDHPPTDAEIAQAVHDWWTANEAVIGPDPDLLLPGQVLHPPDAA